MVIQKRILYQFYNFYISNPHHIRIKFGLAFYKNISAGLADTDYEYLLTLKNFLQEFTGFRARPTSLNFFNILGEKPVFRKKKNMNFSLSFKSEAFFNFIDDNDFSQFVSKVDFWFDIANYLRSKYRVDTGLFVKIFQSSITIILVNPQFITAFLTGDTYYVNTFSNKTVLSVNVFLSDELMKKFFIKFL